MRMLPIENKFLTSDFVRLILIVNMQNKAYRTRNISYSYWLEWRARERRRRFLFRVFKVEKQDLSRLHLKFLRVAWILTWGGLFFGWSKKMSTFFYAKDKYLLQLELTIPHMCGVLLVWYNFIFGSFQLTATKYGQFNFCKCQKRNICLSIIWEQKR
jgi:hypothetical protein